MTETRQGEGLPPLQIDSRVGCLWKRGNGTVGVLKYYELNRKERSLNIGETYVPIGLCVSYYDYLVQTTN